MASKKPVSEKLSNWQGVVTGADPDVIPDDMAPRGANAFITHVGATAGAVRRRKGAVSDGYIAGDNALLGLFDYYSEEWGRIFVAVTDDGGVSAVRVNYNLNWDPDLAFEYETALNAVDHLNAAPDIAGTAVYSLALGTVLDPGTWSLTLTFYPDDQANYTIKRETVTLTVSKRQVLFNWATPANILYGVALDGTQLNATADEAGTFVYTPPSGTVLNAGTHVLSAEFTPTDTAHYIGGTVTVNLFVGKSTPVITWANPAGITYPTALSGVQLNATADVAGAFTYTPPSGTVLNAGNGQTLHADFVPTDTANYNNVDADVTIDVAKATPTITWLDPALIYYPTPLSGTQLNASASVPGSFVYTPPSGTVLSPGAGQTLQVDFTPTDTVNYNSVTDFALITVIQPMEEFWLDGQQSKGFYNTGDYKSPFIDGGPSPEQDI